MIKKILIANRGEIAVRIIKACKELGITSAAIYSDADIKSIHTKLADESYYIGAAPASESYLNKEKIIELAEKINADAIHPGYGFFSENSAFISDVEKSGIIFIGPSSQSVRLMGSKTVARKLMQEHKVPVVPGSVEPIKDLKTGIQVANEIGYPIILKASAGGGGKGMRKLNSEAEFKSSFESSKREAKKAFGNDDIYIEKYIENPKHIEVQIIADKFGNYRHLFERECSIQRRHQKIIEESPSLFVDDELRKNITNTAIKAAKACKYYNAGTIEFLVDKNRNYYFLEMNTRVQVEHPVTELISGIDIVREQIRIAEDKEISFNQEEIKLNGFALECRIYAEDPVNNFMPSTGTIANYSEPNGIGVRVDSGFEEGSEISIHYDPMIAKLICWDNSRFGVIAKMKRALREFSIAGLVTNISFLNSVINSKEFIDGKYNINFIDKSLNENSILFQDKQEHDLQEAAHIFATILKSNKLGNHKNNTSKIINYNKWWEQQYE